MARLAHSNHARIFILKLWQEVLDEGRSRKQTEWRGRIQDVSSGKTHYFRDWPTIVKFISNSMPELERSKRRNSRKRLERTTSTRKVSTAAMRRRNSARKQSA